MIFDSVEKEEHAKIDAFAVLSRLCALNFIHGNELE